MEIFKFNGKIENKFDEFKKFAEGLKDKSKAEIILEMKEELTMGDILDGIEKINKILPEAKITLDFEKIM